MGRGCWCVVLGGFMLLAGGSSEGQAEKGGGGCWEGAWVGGGLPEDPCEWALP